MMKYSYLLLVAVLAFSFPAWAQFDANGRPVEAEPEPMTLAEILPVINKSTTLRSTKYTNAREILGRRVRDNSTKLVGEVSDIYVGSGGTVAGVVTIFNRLHLNGPVVLDMKAEGIKGMDDGYTLALSGDEIKTAFPELQARTKDQPATGMSVKKLVGQDVNSERGEEFAKLKEVLFDYKGEHADIAYLVINYGPMKNKGVAVPYSILEERQERGRPSLVISNDNLETLLNYLNPKQ